MNEGTKEVVIAGAALTAFSPPPFARTRTDLEVEAAARAVADAGIRMADVDGLIVRESLYNSRYHMVVSEVLGLYETPLCTSIGMGGATPGFSVELAKWALEEGRCRYVLVLAGEGLAETAPPFSADAANLSAATVEYDRAYGPDVSSYAAMLARRHIDLCGLTDDELASVPAAARSCAAGRDDAVYRTQLSSADVLGSPLVSTPLHSAHCALPSSGGAALVLTTAERVQGSGQGQVFVLSTAGVHRTSDDMARCAHEEATPGGDSTLTQAAEAALVGAGMTIKEADAVFVDDSFAIHPFILLDALAGAVTGRHHADLTHRLAGITVNPYGGQLSWGTGVANYVSFVEATRLLRVSANHQRRGAGRCIVASADSSLRSVHFAVVGLD